MDENPYKSQSDTSTPPEGESHLLPMSVSKEAIETLEFTGKLVRGVSVFCIVGAFVYLFTTAMGLYYIRDFPFSWFHIAQLYRLLIFPTMLCLGIFGWKYANAIARVSKQKEVKLEFLTNAQGYFWLFVVLHVFIIVWALPFHSRPPGLHQMARFGKIKSLGV